MKKTIWHPLVFGTIMGLLAGAATVSGLMFLIPGIDTDNAIGFWMTLILISAALGGPLAGVLTSTLLIGATYLLGPTDMREVLSDPIVYWSNTIIIGTLAASVGLVYRVLYLRVKMPLRLLPWAGIVIASYAINIPVNISIQFYLNTLTGILPAVLRTYKTYIPQMVFDIVFTSLLFLALPIAFTRPMWFKPN